MPDQSAGRALALAIALTFPLTVLAGETELNGQKFTLAEGWSIELAASPPLVDRPVCVDFDETGALYVFDSSGANDRPQVQQETKPNRLLKLVDTDGDGRFDKQTVFATGLSYSQGATWLDGSLYVASPPEILKFTDEDGDGQAEKREVWYDGKTLTNCGNDVHGPYVGPDGYMYWGKGGSGDQPQTLAGGKQLVSKACHVLRRKLTGGPVEVVTSGGMQNIVGIAFTSTGEPIYTGTFISPTRPGWRDGLTHAIYGGVYGPLNGRLDGIPRTGELLPVLDELGAAAPCGITRLESAAFQHGNDIFLACQFNMRKVSRHELVPQGSTYRSVTTDLLVSDNRDFHPTDVVEDADGSILVVDTGGWYKLCCPTSQLPKPDVLGGIYRLRKKDAPRVDDPRGRSIAWNRQSASSLCDLLDDPRPAVRRSAQRRLIRLGPPAISSLQESVVGLRNPWHGREVLWTLAQIDSDPARQAMYRVYHLSLPKLNCCLAWIAGNSRDERAVGLLVKMLESSSPADARIAAMALGRIGSPEALSKLMHRLEQPTDRALEHAVIYAAIEINRPSAVSSFLASQIAPVRRAAMIAIDQIDAKALSAEDVVPALASSDSALSAAAWWIAEQHLNWAESLAPEFRRLAQANDAKAVLAHLPAFAAEPATQRLMAELLLDGNAHRDTRLAVLRSMSVKRPKPLPPAWREPLARALQSSDEDSINAALDVIRPEGRNNVPRDFEPALMGLAENEMLSPRLRLMAQSFLPASDGVLPKEVAGVAVAHLGPEHPLELRSLALDCLEKRRLEKSQISPLLDLVPVSGTMELKRLIPLIRKDDGSEVGKSLIERLSQNPASTSLPVEFIAAQFKGGDGALDRAADELIHQVQAAAGEKLKLLEDSLARVSKANPRKGQEVFTSTRALCSSCHAVGFLGARIGPDLTRISKIRNERDLLESILFPSASFVRGFEPTVIATTDGRVLSGTVKEENAQEVTLQIDAQKTVRIPAGEIESRKPGTVSIMPAGLEKQLSSEELADLVAFLMASN